MEKHYYIYKIICLKGSLKNHYYIGKHETYNIFDNYAGSGVLLKKYYKKYGKCEGISYKMEIFCFCNSTEELNILEEKYISDKYETDPKCLNIIKGGVGGIDGRIVSQSWENLSTYWKRCEALKGRKWINNGIEEKIIKIQKLQDYYNKGWINGRLHNNC